MHTITLAENLKSLRNKHSLTQKDISSYLHVSRQCYSQYESGQRTPSFSTIIQLASFYHISLDDLFSYPSAAPRVLHNSSKYHNHLSTQLSDPQPQALSQTEINLINVFRKTNLSTQKKVFHYLQTKSLHAHKKEQCVCEVSTSSNPQP